MQTTPELPPSDTTFEIEALLTEFHQIVLAEAPHLDSLFSVFANEARFGRQWLQGELGKLPTGARILEVGAGLLLLSCQLAREGFRITAVEPFGEGFSHFSTLQSIILKHASAKGVLPEIISTPIEALEIREYFDFAFSINVMEHVRDVPLAISKVTRALRQGRSYRFTCANYSFPYEPHFNIPTLFSKPLTKRIYAKSIANNTRVIDPGGVWDSLNWITVYSVSKAVHSIPGLTARFSRTIFRDTMLRVVNDPLFSERRSPAIRGLIAVLVACKLHRLAAFVPAFALPLMDCTITRSDGLIGVEKQ